MLSVVLLGASTASPFTNQQASFTDEDEAAFEERLLDTELTSSDSAKFITNSNVEGDFSLLSVPWARGASVTFNDTTASTLSTVGNAALFLGGLYLLSGFPAAASALADPFGISRHLGVAAPTRTARPRVGAPAPRFQHRISKGEEG